ncbi:MAG TPA: energy transducer TonB, partial [Caulobacteraceae bacterium]|nr:energy transducer TonB [Caulobacteraceae bacterium]
DGKGCAILKAARFAPATDGSGTAVHGLIDAQVKWPQGQVVVGASAPDVELNLSHMPAGVTGRPVADLALTVSATGAVESCDVLKSAGRADFNSIACTTGVKDGQIAAAKDAGGRSVRSVQALNVRFAVYAHIDQIPADRIHDVYPDRALKAGVSGFAVIRCDAKPDDHLDDCAVDEESPPGFDFGEATLRLAKDGQFRLTPAELGEVFIVMKFEPSRER